VSLEGEPEKLATQGSPTEPEPPPTVTEVVAAKEAATREWIAYSLLAILAGTILGGFVTIWATSASTTDVKDLLVPMVTGLIGLLGAVTGFYYGVRSATAAQSKTSSADRG
jgi:TctA family transporter